MSKSDLSLVERGELLKLEEHFEALRAPYRAARERLFKVGGPILMEIRDRRLWRHDYESFEEYCVKRWDITGGRANQLILGTKVVNELSTDGIKQLVDNESTARALAKVPREHRQAAIERAAADGKVTAPAITKAATLAAAPKQELDATGYPIHSTILDLWNRRDEVNQLVSQISEIKCFIEQQWEKEDPIFMLIHQDALIKLKTLHYYLASAKIEYVCGFCQGKCKILGQHCEPCHGTGLMTKIQWDRLVPEQLKRDRNK